MSDMQIYTWSEQVLFKYLHGGVYLHMCKLTFTYMQLRSHAQKYTRVQIIHICIIYTPGVNQRMWTGLKQVYIYTGVYICTCAN